MDLSQRVLDLLDLPRGDQLAAVRALCAELDGASPDEDWNTRFGPTSLFDAWTRSSVVRGIYNANRAWLQRTLTPGFVALELGGGDGRLWSGLSLPSGTLVVVDPEPASHAQVARSLPDSITLTSIVGRVEDVLDQLPHADAAVCSLTLHHVAGRDARERAAHGLSGPGKREVLAALRERVRGPLVVNEADVFCELSLPSGHPQLRDHLLDSYVRRCGRALAHDLRRGDLTPDQAARTSAVLHRWCLNQVAMAEVPLADRDVYELDAERWLELFPSAGWRVHDWAFTDPYRLFARYELV
jgi:hypothetical protein